MIQEEINRIIRERILKIEDKYLREFIIHILNYELQIRDQERPRFTDEYMKSLERMWVKAHGGKQT